MRHQYLHGAGAAWIRAELKTDAISRFEIVEVGVKDLSVEKEKGLTPAARIGAGDKAEALFQRLDCTFE